MLPHPNYWKARVGEHNLKEKDNGEKKIEVSQVYYYPWYSGYDNDIALMKLSEPVPESSNIKPICLPLETDNFNTKWCSASGWGKVDFCKHCVSFHIYHTMPCHAITYHADSM